MFVYVDSLAPLMQGGRIGHVQDQAIDMTIIGFPMWFLLALFGGLSQCFEQSGENKRTMEKEKLNRGVE